MPMRESDGASGGYGVRPAQPARGIVQTGGQVARTTPVRLPVRRPPQLRARRGRR